jgi:hypothetical protein
MRSVDIESLDGVAAVLEENENLRADRAHNPEADGVV